ncbi:LCP family protein [Actinomadura bangladeshensis]|uniref:LytR family transcriptional regulator n=1 Tax=Actinomadura bangladeshensis TaxID=453573 RepID=A0A4R4P7I9_9ACTN|nr:LCP family protein [Actinomadura bangladeshensis]TDC18471.1 LytR family transcriptional regulator [Actinomadura bangladeshensis]
MTAPEQPGPRPPQRADQGPQVPAAAQAGEGSADAPTGEAGDAFWASADGTERKRKRRWPRVLIAIGVFVALLVAGIGGLLWQRQSSYNGNIDRIKGALPTDQANRPGPNVEGTENWLLVGSDSRAESPTTGEGGDVWKPGRQRTDTIMLLHLPADRKKAYIVSFPRDSWVPVPGYGKQKINAAFSYGGPKLLIETMESITGVRIDHYGAIDFEGFKSMTDALGGVTVNIKQSVYDPARKKEWAAGRQKLNGEEALLFVRQRYNLPNGDFDRIKRQQAFLGALAKQAADRGTVTNPLKLDRFLSALTKSISVDEEVSSGDLRSLALSMRSVRASDVVFMTLPHKGTGMRGKQSVVFVDWTKGKQLFSAVKTAQMAQYVQQHGAGNSLGAVS